MRNTGARVAHSLPTMVPSSQWAAEIRPCGPSEPSSGMVTVVLLPRSCTMFRATVSSGLIRPSWSTGSRPAAAMSAPPLRGDLGRAASIASPATIVRATIGVKNFRGSARTPPVALITLPR